MRTLADALRWRARRHPDLPASWFQGRTRTFGDLDRSTTELAAGLVAAGIKPATTSASSTRTATTTTS